MIDVVKSGWSETVNNGDAIWDLADAVDRVNALVNQPPCLRQAWDQSVGTLFDQPIRHLITYSYANATVVQEMERRRRAGLPLHVTQWTILVAVNRVLNGQKWEDLVQVPDAVESAAAFNTVYRGAVPGRIAVVPECCPIRNPGPSRINVDCFYEGFDHSNLPGKPVVMGLVVETQRRLVGLPKE